MKHYIKLLATLTNLDLKNFPKTATSLNTLLMQKPLFMEGDEAVQPYIDHVIETYREPTLPPQTLKLTDNAPEILTERFTEELFDLLNDIYGVGSKSQQQDMQRQIDQLILQFLHKNRNTIYDMSRSYR